eukprot:scaffold44081_cov168-Amphora_coffeaeformis.AAC.1
MKHWDSGDGSGDPWETPLDRRDLAKASIVASLPSCNEAGRRVVSCVVPWRLPYSASRMNEWVHPPVLSGCCSKTKTRWPARASKLAQAQPPEPLPMTIVSMCFGSRSGANELALTLASRSEAVTVRVDGHTNQVIKAMSAKRGTATQNGKYDKADKSGGIVTEAPMVGIM